MSNFAGDLAKLNRRMDALERNRGSVLRFANVVGTENGQVRVQLADGQDMVTAFLPILQKRVLKDQHICLPDIGEPVAVLFSGKGYEDGVCLGAIYSKNAPAPKQPAHIEYKRFSDGTEIFYDREKHLFFADIKGDIDVKTTGNATLAIKGDANITVKGNARLTVGGAVNIEAQKSITLASSVRVNLDAPIIGISGILQYTGQGGKAGNASFSGNVAIENGSLNVPDNDVTAKGIRLASHTHSCKEGGTSQPAGG